MCTRIPSFLNWPPMSLCWLYLKIYALKNIYQQPDIHTILLTSKNKTSLTQLMYHSLFKCCCSDTVNIFCSVWLLVSLVSAPPSLSSLHSFFLVCGLVRNFVSLQLNCVTRCPVSFVSWPHGVNGVRSCDSLRCRCCSIISEDSECFI